MSYKLLFLDVDGTLIHKDNRISPENMSAIERACQQGIKITIASGRCKAMTMELSKRLGLDRFGSSYAISLNGAHIINVSSGETLHTSPISLKIAEMLWKKALNLNIDSHFYSENKIYHHHKNAFLTRFYEKSGCECIILTNFVKDIKETPLKYILIDDNHALLEQFRQEMLPYTNGILTAEYSSLRSLEYTSVHAGKGSGLEFVCKLHGFLPKDAIAMGDGENDLSMLHSAGLGIAPANALDTVKNAVSEITQNDCEHNAVQEVIYKYFLR